MSELRKMIAKGSDSSNDLNKRQILAIVKDSLVKFGNHEVYYRLFYLPFLSVSVLEPADLTNLRVGLKPVRHGEDLVIRS